jgi:hypothetical protein
LLPVAFHVTQVTFQFRFAPAANGKPKPLAFTVSYPDSSDLKSQREEYRLLGEKYLKRWGIYRG